LCLPHGAGRQSTPAGVHEIRTSAVWSEDGLVLLDRPWSSASMWAYRLGSSFLLQEIMGRASPGVATAYVRSTGRPLEGGDLAR
jgi:hypothetical protein